MNYDRVSIGILLVGHRYKNINELQCKLRLVQWTSLSGHKFVVPTRSRALARSGQATTSSLASVPVGLRDAAGGRLL